MYDAFTLDSDFNVTFFFCRLLDSNAITSIPDSFVQNLTTLQKLLVLVNSPHSLEMIESEPVACMTFALDS